MGDITQQAQAYEIQKQQEAEQAALNKPADIGHDRLLAALYKMWDGFDRSNILMFGIKDTGKAIHNQQNLVGDHLDIGVRKLEWLSGNKHVFDDFAAQYYHFVKEDANTIEYMVDDVPVFIHIFEDNPYVTQCDALIYENETFNLPNPYEEFVKEYEQ